MSTIFQIQRRIIFGLVAAVVLLSVQGCGSSGNPPGSNANPAAAAPPISRPSTGPDASTAVADEQIPGNPTPAVAPEPIKHSTSEHSAPQDYSSLLFVFMLATFIGLGVILRVSRLLHTPLMSLTNAISAIAVVGSIIVTGSEGYPPFIRFLGGIALFASMTNIVSGFLITDRMLKMFKSPGQGGKR
jgi:NAD(P) transhydrogenase subunit alpha